MAKRRRVAVVIELDWALKYLVETYAGCQRYAAEVGWDCTLDPFADLTMKSPRGAGSYDGILGRPSRQLADKAAQAGVPVVNVYIGTDARNLPSVFPDFEAAGAMAAEHLMGRGFRRFGFLGFVREVASRLALRGFRSAIKASGLSCSVHRYPMNSPTRRRTWGAFRAGLEAWVDTWSTPIGVYSTRDLPCRYLIDVCRSKGLRMPGDVAVIGAGNEDVICASPAPSLTSIDLGYAQVGYQAAAMLDRLMHGEAPPQTPQLISPAKLIPRQSTDSYAVDDPVVAQALRFIAEHGHEPIKVSDVAAATHAARRSLERRFQEAMGRTIGQEIMRLRLERAKRRLVESDLPLKNVARHSGFTSDNHFYRTFVRLEGISPKAYRKARRQES